MIHNFVWVIVEITTSFFEILFMFMFLNGFFRIKKVPFLTQSIGFIAFFAIHFTVSTLFYQEQSVMLLSTCVLAMCISLLLYSGKFYVRIFSPLLIVVLLVIIEMISVILVRLVFKIEDMDIIQTNPLYKLITIVTKNILSFILVKSLTFFRRSETGNIKTIFRLLLMSVPVITLLSAFTILDLVIKSAQQNVDFAIFGLVGLMYVNVIVFAIFEGFMRQMEKEYGYKLMEKQLDMQLSHYDQLAQSRAHIREIWHDFKNHVNCMKLLHSNNEAKALGDYLENLSHFRDVNKVIDSGNPVIDALLNNKQNIAKQNGIDCKVELGIPANLPITPADICTILGNAFDNAIEACGRITDETIKKDISLSLTYQQGYLALVLTNSMLKMPVKEGKFFRTSKLSPEHHGIGMQSIDRVVQKYQGNMQINLEPGIFQLKILLAIDAEKCG